MPKVIKSFRGWRIVIWPNDHAPPHVHVIGPAMAAKFDLLCNLKAVHLHSHHGFTISQLKALEKYLIKNLHTLYKAWGAIHGN